MNITQTIKNYDNITQILAPKIFKIIIKLRKRQSRDAFIILNLLSKNEPVPPYYHHDALR